MLLTLIALAAGAVRPPLDPGVSLSAMRSQLRVMQQAGLAPLFRPTQWPQSSRKELASLTLQVIEKLRRQKPDSEGRTVHLKGFCRLLHPIIEELKPEISAITRKGSNLSSGLRRTVIRFDAILNQSNQVPDVPENHFLYEAQAKLKHVGLSRGFVSGLFRGGRPDTLTELTVKSFIILHNLEAAVAEVEHTRDRARAKELSVLMPLAQALVDLSEPRFDAVGFDIDLVENDMRTLPLRLEAVSRGAVAKRMPAPVIADDHLKGTRDPFENSSTIPDVPESHFIYEAVARIAKVGLNRGMPRRDALRRGQDLMTKSYAKIYTFLAVRNLEDETDKAWRNSDQKRARELLNVLPDLKTLVDRWDPDFVLDTAVIKEDMSSLPPRLTAIAEG